MANTNLTIDMITREALRIAHEKLTYLGTIDRQYDDSFSKTGAKIGSTLRIRQPVQYVRRTGSRIMDVQDSETVATTVTVSTQDGVDMRFNSQELSQDIDDFSKNHIEPAMAVLVSGIESDVLQAQTKLAYNVVGTTANPMTDLVEAGLARARLNQMLAPKENRCIQLDSVTASGMVNGLSGLFHDGSQIKSQYKEGALGRIAGFDWFENERVLAHANGDDVTGTLDSATTVTDGGNTMDFSGTITTETVGSVFTVAGIFACHAETKASLGFLQQYTILTSASGVITVSPNTFLTGAKQNVCTAAGAVTTLAANWNTQTPAVVFVGAVTASIKHQLAYTKEWAAFVTADLPLMANSEKCVRRVQDGLSLRCWTDSDIRNDEMLTRIDILYGHQVLRPEWGCRITN